MLRQKKKICQSDNSFLVSERDARILLDVSPTTIEAVLVAMVKSGSVQRIGSGGSTRYIKK